MKLELDITDERWGFIDLKAKAEGLDATQMLEEKINEYADACGRDVKATAEAQLLDNISKLDAAGKAALLMQSNSLLVSVNAQ